MVTSGLWLLFGSILADASSLGRCESWLDAPASGICSVVILVFWFRFRRVITWHVVAGVGLLFAGFFVLRLSPMDSGPERAIWIPSLRLFLSRALPLVGLLAVLIEWRPGARFGCCQDFVQWWLSLPRWAYMLIASALVFLSAFLMAKWGYTCMPRVDDGVAHVFQARIFTSGRLTLPPPPHPNAFHQFGLIQEPAWVAHYPPGYPALLSLGLLLGSACLINPLLTALTVVPLERVAYTLYGKRVASVALLLFVASPFVAVVGGSFRNHPLTLFLLAWSTALLIHPSMRSRSVLLAGFMGGIALLARPYTAFLWCLGLILGIGISRPRHLWRTILLFGLGAVPGILLFVLYTRVQTGGLLISPSVYLYGEKYGIGFGERVMGQHTLLRAISYTSTRIEALGRMIVGWPFSFVLLPLTVWVLGRERLLPKESRWVVILPTLLLPVGYSLFWCLEFTHGPRFLYSLFITVLPMGAQAIFRLPRGIERVTGDVPRWSAKPLVIAALVLSVLYSLLVTWPDVLRVFGKGYGCEIDLPHLVRELPSGRKLIFYGLDPENEPDYGWGFLLNDLDLAGETIVVMDGGQEENAEVKRLFPHRRIYHYSYDHVHRKGTITDTSDDASLHAGQTRGI